MLIPPAAMSAPTKIPNPNGRPQSPVALQAYQAVADQPAGDAAEADRREGGSPGRW